VVGACSVPRRRRALGAVVRLAAGTGRPGQPRGGLLRCSHRRTARGGYGCEHGVVRAGARRLERPITLNFCLRFDFFQCFTLLPFYFVFCYARCPAPFFVCVSA